jgi:hypothetical protein
MIIAYAFYANVYTFAIKSRQYTVGESFQAALLWHVEDGF